MVVHKVTLFLCLKLCLQINRPTSQPHASEPSYHGCLQAGHAESCPHTLPTTHGLFPHLRGIRSHLTSRRPLLTNRQEKHQPVSPFPILIFFFPHHSSPSDKTVKFYLLFTVCLLYRGHRLHVGRGMCLLCSQMHHWHL